TVTLIPNGIHHPPIEDGRLLPNSVKLGVPFFFRDLILLFISFLINVTVFLRRVSSDSNPKLSKSVFAP
ncbi:hypothetical protein SJ887_05930, partial [Enterococcus faecium]